MNFTKKEFQKDRLSFCEENDGPIYNDFRVIAVPLENGEFAFKWFNQNHYNSHSDLFNKMNYEYKIDYDKLESFGRDGYRGIFGAFYAVLGGNSSKMRLCIYGSSSDYDILRINYIGLRAYRAAFAKYAQENDMDLIWMLL